MCVIGVSLFVGLISNFPMHRPSRGTGRNNIDVLVEDGYEYILGARIKNENTAVRRRIPALNLREGQVASVHTDDDLRIVVSYTEKRRKKDAFNRSRGLQRL